MNQTHIHCLIVTAALALVACAAENTEETLMRHPRIVAKEGIAIDGFDPVSYSEGAPVRGLPELELNWAGLRWRFASPNNRSRFERAPERFVPQYGGHCALAMSFGEVAQGSPDSWSIDRGKLYFHNSAITAFLFKYLPGRARAADRRWSAIETKSNPRESIDGKASL